jgi:hypothetical protein
MFICWESVQLIIHVALLGVLQQMTVSFRPVALFVMVPSSDIEFVVLATAN